MGSALIIVDLQADFLPGGALAVPGGDAVIDPINGLARSSAFDLVVATRDWHPPDHRSFTDQGGPWPVHCVADTPGAELDPRLERGRIDAIVDKGRRPEVDGYSAFADDSELASLLREEQIRAVTVVGLATDYCVRHTVLDAIREALVVTVPREAIAAVDVSPGDGERALAEMAGAGAVLT